MIRDSKSDQQNRAMNWSPFVFDGDLQKGIFAPKKNAAISFQVYIEDINAVACESKAVYSQRPFC